MIKRIIVLMLVIGLVSGIGAFTGLAVFTDQETVADNTFGSGNVDLLLGTTTALVTFTNMKPGDTTGPQSLLVTNNGTIDFTYVMSTTIDSDAGTTRRGAALGLARRQDGNQEGCVAPRTGDDGAERYGGADLTDGVLASRALSASTNETLCFEVDFPSAATAPEGASADANFVFDATQA